MPRSIITPNTEMIKAPEDYNGADIGVAAIELLDLRDFVEAGGQTALASYVVIGDRRRH